MNRRVAVLSVAVVAILVLGVTAVIFPDYFRLLRPSVLKQLDPQVVALVNELPGVDKQNKEIIGLFAHGGLAHAKEGRRRRHARGRARGERSGCSPRSCGLSLASFSRMTSGKVWP